MNRYWEMSIFVYTGLDTGYAPVYEVVKILYPVWY